VPSITDTIFGAVIQAAEDYAYMNDMGIVANSTSDNLERQQMYLNSLLTEPLAGIVVVPAPGTQPDILITMQEQGIPVILLDRKLQGLEADYIGSDNIQGAYEAVKHLIDNGYRRIATVAGARNVSTGVDRLTGYHMAMAEARLEVKTNWVQHGDFDEQKSYAAIQSLIEQSHPPDAVFVANDAMMIGALQAIKDFGVRVPDDLALVGFDELPLVDLLTPALTTVEQSAEDLGKEAIRLLLDRVKSANRAVRIVQIPTKLNIREST
jgi:LacI family transcriptional regulator